MTRRNIVKTPPRRKSVINVFQTPPLRRPLQSSSRRELAPSSRPSETVPPSPQRAVAPQRHPRPVPAAFATSGHDDCDAHTLSAMGDISMTAPYYVPGGAGTLSPPPSQRARTPNLQLRVRAIAHPQRPRPPAAARRVVSEGVKAYKFRTITVKGGLKPMPVASPDTILDEETIRPPVSNNTPAVRPASAPLSPERSCDLSNGSIDDEPELSTPQSRFEVFMRSRDLTQSPKKRNDSVAERNRRLNELSTEASGAMGREIIRPTRPLRGNARLPPRLPIPDWGAMAIHIDN
ncbi:hypothetical protein GGX14DRAFT_401840 [Mycena pura]|uniref:Uncharacterized protein n=1 Tax=Mycena pura TaxID=153505 RepID=A0AAD6V1R8_9AGAR|nr:hypothetical protein GGX14DRAFT_401840 [Mycena pura]